MKLTKNLVKLIVKTKQAFLIRTIQRVLTLIERVEAKAKKSRIVPFLNQHYPDLQVVLYDIGAAGGIEPVYRHLLNLNHFIAIGFEPDEQEIERLKQSSELQLYPYAIAGNPGKRNLFITNFSHCSSLYPPNQEVINEFPVAEFFKVINTKEVEVTSLDEFVKKNQVVKPDFLKIDAQGAEYEILIGGSSIADSVVGILFETHLRELYEGQGLFPSIHNLLIGLDFRCIDLKSNQHFAGEVLELNVAYVRGINYLSSID
jgi:FkbM family methyltransferase